MSGITEAPMYAECCMAWSECKESAATRLSWWAGCAVTAGALVGLDVEESGRSTRQGDPLRLARRRFSPAEIASLEGAQPMPCKHLVCLACLHHAQAVNRISSPSFTFQLVVGCSPSWLMAAPRVHQAPAVSVLHAPSVSPCCSPVSHTIPSVVAKGCVPCLPCCRSATEKVVE